MVCNTNTGKLVGPQQRQAAKFACTDLANIDSVFVDIALLQFCGKGYEFYNFADWQYAVA